MKTCPDALGTAFDHVAGMVGPRNAQGVDVVAIDLGQGRKARTSGVGAIVGPVGDRPRKIHRNGLFAAHALQACTHQHHNQKVSAAPLRGVSTPKPLSPNPRFQRTPPSSLTSRMDRSGGGHRTSPPSRRPDHSAFIGP